MSYIILAILVILVGILFFSKKRLSVEDDCVLIKDVHVIDGNGNEFMNQNVLIEHGKITQISEKDICVHNVKIIDAKGKTLMPGLIDSHTHMQGTTNKSEAESNEFLNNKVPMIFRENIFPYGITTIKELGSPRHFIYQLKDKINSGEIIGPRLLVVGPNITARDGHPAITLGGDNQWIRKELAAEISTEEEARQIVRELAENKVDFIKIVYQGGQYFYFDTELYIKKLEIGLVKVIIDEGSKCNLLVSAHVRNKADVMELLQAGIYGIDHGITDVDIDATDAILSLWKEQGAYYIPTINALTYEHDKTLFCHSMHNLKFIFDAGIKIALGTDNMLEVLSGDVVHKELAYYVQAGLTPMQAIVTATRNGAEYLGILDETGTVEIGKDADLIFLNSNPLVDIQNIQDIEVVWKKGKMVFSKNTQKSVVLPNFNFEKSLNLLYKDELHKKESKLGRRRLIMQKQENECTAEIECIYDNGIAIKEHFVCEQNLLTKEWAYNNESGGNQLYGVWENGNVSLSGQFNGKTVDKRFDMSGKLWMQMGEFNLCSFAKAQEEEINYFSIGTGENRGALEMTEFTSRKEGIEIIEVSGISYECIKISTVISKYSFIWTGYGWYEKESGKLIRYSSKGNEQDKLEIQV